MRNKNEELPDYDKVKKLRMDLLMFLLIVITGFVVVFCIVRHNEIENLKDDVNQAKAEKQSVQKYNKQIEKKQQKQLEEVGLKNVKNDMNTFNELFFNWNSWGEYSRNMKELRNLYPKIEKGDIVNISGKNVGSGESPESSYESDYLTTTNKNEISEVVNQSKDFNNGESNTLWFITGKEEDGETLDITHMNHYREINPEY